ncbi:MAG: head completion/stabilization protein [Algicola sp.]|nr:head completion/stabilization protein [Algicola sp.]
MSFTSGTGTGKNTDYLNATLTNETFYPDISLGQFHARYRIPAEYEKDAVTEQLTLAMVEINKRLQDSKSSWIDEGATDLATASIEKMNNKSIFVMWYEKAVYCFAKAKLLKEFETAQTKETAENAAKSSEKTTAYYLKETDEAVAELIGKKMFLAELL